MARASLTILDKDDPTELDVGPSITELYTPTEEDLKRVMTREEQHELCLKHKCRVQIWKWNPVHDYRMEFTKSGRYQRWSNKLRLRMLAYAMNKTKPMPEYDENEIAEIRKIDWEMEKKNSIMSLNFWKREREQQLHSKPQEINSIVDDPVINPNATDPERLSSSEYTDNVGVFCNVNTESMTIGTQSQMTEQNVQPSQDVISSDYDNFNNEIPLTSTQSQHPEDLIDCLD